MENKLRSLFEYQRFEGNKRLSKLISETEEREIGELSDEALETVAAAGELTAPEMQVPLRGEDIHVPKNEV